VVVVVMVVCHNNGIYLRFSALCGEPQSWRPCLLLLLCCCTLGTLLLFSLTWRRGWGDAHGLGGGVLLQCLSREEITTTRSPVTRCGMRAVPPHCITMGGRRHSDRLMIILLGSSGQNSDGRWSKPCRSPPSPTNTRRWYNQLNSSGSSSTPPSVRALIKSIYF